MTRLTAISTSTLPRSATVPTSPPNVSLSGTLMRAAPHSASAIHHHGAQDTVVYAVSGHGAIVSLDETGAEKREGLAPGDWALIPKGREHREENAGEEEVVWVICRSGGEPSVVNLSGWGGEVVG